MEVLQTEVLVVGGGTGGVAAALQAARRGAQTILVSEFEWLGGMLTSAGVAAPDGLELRSQQTGIWGAFLRSLQQRQPAGLDHAWVSFFTYEPHVGAAIFADWVAALPHLQWLKAGSPLEVCRQGDRVTGVRFAEYLVEAAITLDATELGDLLALAEVPFRWGWEWRSQWQEPSAPVHPSTLTQLYPVQAPTWVFCLQTVPAISASDVIQRSDSTLGSLPVASFAGFADTWAGYGATSFLNYGRLPQHQFMINWPQSGNDYGLNADRLIQSESSRQEFLQDAYAHAHHYADFLQRQLQEVGEGVYELATHAFPTAPIGGGAFALHPYYRESRRLRGQVTVIESDILPSPDGQVASLPIDANGQVSAVAIGNYANDHHYPGFRFPLHPKSIRWGGRWTGTPFALPYGCLVPESIDGLMVCEKNIAVSHIANGATRLQPTVLGIGQAAGMAAALCIEQHCQPRELAVRSLQEALLTDPTAPMAVIPLLNLVPDHPDWLKWQRYYLDHPDAYPIDGNAPIAALPCSSPSLEGISVDRYEGQFERRNQQDYQFQVTWPDHLAGQSVQLVTLEPQINQQLQALESGVTLHIWGTWNRSGNWLMINQVSIEKSEI